MAANRDESEFDPASETRYTEERSRRGYQTLRRLVIALLVLASAGPLSLNLVDPDLWGHVRYAEEWIAEGELPRTATHTYTAVGHPWINHENLAEQLLARGFRSLGVHGMLAAKVALGMSILLLMSLAARRQGVRPITAWACFLLVAHNLQAFFPLRPQLLSFLCFGVMLYAIDRAFAGWGTRRTDFQHQRRKNDPTAIRWAWLVALPFLFAVWANSHGGFVAGYAILLAILIGKSIELFARLGSNGSSTVARFAALGGVCGLATLANPYGWELHRWMIGSLGTPRPEITEWGPPLPGSPVFLPFVAIAIVSVGALLLSDRRRDPVQIAILALVGWQAASHLRHIAFFALLCGFWLPPHVQSIVSRIRQRANQELSEARLTPFMSRCLAAGLALAIGLQSLYLGQRISSFPVHRVHYPVDAVQWMADQNVQGKLVVCFNWAQYALAALAPNVQVEFDGRFRTCYPQSEVDAHFDFLVGDRHPRHRSPGSGPIDGTRVLQAGDPDFLLIDRNYKEPAAVMERIAETQAWTLVYQDSLAQVWGRTDRVDRPESPQYVPPAHRIVSDHASLKSVPWPALPKRRTTSQAFGDLQEVAQRNASSKATNRTDEG